jgi:FkbM family methyltransferase
MRELRDRMKRQLLPHVVRPVRDQPCLGATRPRELLSSPLQTIVEPTHVSLPPPQQPSGSWVTRSLVALLRQHRLPTRVSRWLDRSLIALGLPTKTFCVRGLQFRVRRLTADEFFVREVLIDRQYNPAGFEINPTDNVLDIGGNVGAFAVGAASQAGRGRVISVEPVQENFSLLVRNVGLNQLKNIIPVRAAVLAQRRPVTVYLSPEGTGSHSVFADVTGSPRGEQQVDGVTLPDLFEQYQLDVCHFLKLDCEGAEYEILYGLPESYFPRIEKLAIEYHARGGEPKRTQSDKLVAHLQAVGYRIEGYTDVADTPRGMIHARRI